MNIFLNPPVGMQQFQGTTETKTQTQAGAFHAQPGGGHIFSAIANHQTNFDVEDSLLGALPSDLKGLLSEYGKRSIELHISDINRFLQEGANINAHFANDVKTVTVEGIDNAFDHFDDLKAIFPHASIQST